MNHDASNPPVDPAVVRRTLTIAGTFFGLGILLAGLWVYKEVHRVRTMERLDALPTGSAVNGSATPTASTNSSR